MAHRFEPPRFEEAEAQAILREAMHPSEPGLELDEIVRTGAESGIPEARIREAAERVRAGRREAGLAAEYRREMRSGFLAHLVPYLGVNLMMAWFALVGKSPWVALTGTLFGWGIGLAFHALATFHERGAAYRDGFRQYVESKTDDGLRNAPDPVN